MAPGHSATPVVCTMLSWSEKGNLRPDRSGRGKLMKRAEMRALNRTILHACFFLGT